MMARHTELHPYPDEVWNKAWSALPPNAHAGRAPRR